MTDLAVAETTHPGSLSCYTKRGCREPQCCDAARKAWRYSSYRKRSNNPKYKIISAKEARNHLIWLASQGASLDSVSQASGVSLSPLQAIRSGKQKTVRSTTATKILNVIPRVNAKVNSVNGPQTHVNQISFPVVPPGVVPGSAEWYRIMKAAKT